MDQLHNLNVPVSIQGTWVSTNEFMEGKVAAEEDRYCKAGRCAAAASEGWVTQRLHLYDDLSKHETTTILLLYTEAPQLDGWLARIEFQKPLQDALVGPDSKHFDVYSTSILITPNLERTPS